MRSQLCIPNTPGSPIQSTLSPLRQPGNYSAQKEELYALKQRVMKRKKTYGKENGGLCKSSIFMHKQNHESKTKSPIKILGDRGNKPETIWGKHSQINSGIQDIQQLKLKENKQKEIEKTENLISDINLVKIEEQNFPTLKIEDFQIGDLLGKGASAKVRLAMHKSTRFLVSIKTIPRLRIEQKLQKFLQALKIQLYLDHPNIVKIYGIIVEVKEVHIVMEFCTDGDLSTNRKLFSTQSASTKQTLYSLTQSLDYLHSNRIQHRDLKLENILLCYSVPKITDFELSVYTKCRFIQRRTMCGSPAYFSPQMIQKHRYNKKADIWCLGIIFYQLLCGCFPFQMEKMEDIENIVCKQIKEMPSTISYEAKELILSMLNKQSQERIEIEGIIGSRFFKSCIQEKGQFFRG